MRAIKLKVDATKPNEWTGIVNPPLCSAVRIQAIKYSNEGINNVLRLRDRDEDEFIFITGQANGRAVNLDSPISVNLPISYFDEDGGGLNEVIIWAEALDNNVPEPQ